MKHSRIIAILFFGIAGWCSAGDPVFHFDVGTPPPRYRVIIKDNPSELRFELTLISYDDRPICLGYGGWPNSSGQIHWGSEWVKLESNGRFIPVHDENFGYCEGSKCTIHVPPHKRLTGFIGYREFGEVEQISRLPDRQLHFDPLVYVCRPPE
jgi:hypothetical protein